MLGIGEECECEAESQKNLRLGNFSSLILMRLTWNSNRGFAISRRGFLRLAARGRGLETRGSGWVEYGVRGGRAASGCNWFARAEL
jgi:hypothetical protein